MVENKHIIRIIVVLMAMAVAVCFLAIGNSEKLTEWLGGRTVRMEYESKLFDTDEIISVNIQMDEDDWNKMLQNATSEEYYVCDVTINGKTIKNVAIRPKGNTSLSAIAMDEDTDRFSLKLEFDHFVEGQTCFGLDKLILNNNYADATNMKEAIIYDMFQYLGADASLYNYAKVSVNGEYWGVYLALEGVEDSFMLRNYGTQNGELYKPDSMEMGGGNNDDSKSDSMSGGMDFSNMGNFPQGGRKEESGSEPSEGTEDNRPSFSGGDFSFDPDNMPDMGSFRPSGTEADGNPDGNEPSENSGDNRPSFPSGDFSFDPDNMPDMGGSGERPDMGGFSSGNGGANLNYTDDDLDSYSTIWEGEITGSGKNDHRRVVTALKHISEGDDLETYLDVDNVLKYMAVHTFSVNMDSLSGSMAHNYYLYESNGQLNILPWDYNLSLGGMSMGGGSGTDMVNDPIDTPFSGTHFFDALLENEEYLERYHEYLRQLVEEYVNGGTFDETYSRIRSQIDSLVETDPTAFYSYEDYEKATGILYDAIKLRAESIEGQLNGTIPSTDEGQNEDSSALIDASDLDIHAMGQFSMGMGDGGNDFVGRRRPKPSDSSSEETPSEQPESFDFSNMPSDFDPSNMPDMSNFNPGDMPDMGNTGSPEKPDSSESGSPESTQMPEVSSFENGMPSSFPGAPGQTSSVSKQKNLITFGICFLAMLGGVIAVSFVKRRK